MQATAKRVERVRAAFAEIPARDALLWLGATALAGAIILLAFRPQTEDCLSWFENNHAVLLRLIGERDSGCGSASDTAECTARARHALDVLRNHRTRSDPFDISDGTCAAIRQYSRMLQ